MFILKFSKFLQHNLLNCLYYFAFPIILEPFINNLHLYFNPEDNYSILTRYYFNELHAIFNPFIKGNFILEHHLIDPQSF